MLVTVAVAALSSQASAGAQEPDGLSAQVTVPVSVENQSPPYMYGDRYLIDGDVRNPDGADPVENVMVEVEYEDAAHNSLGGHASPVDCWVLPAGLFATFRAFLTPVSGWDHVHLSAYGEPSTSARVPLVSEFVSRGTGALGPDGYRWYRFRIINANDFTVVGAIPTAWEFFTPTAGSRVHWGVLEPEWGYQSRLAPGESTEVVTRGFRAPSEPGTFTYEASPMEALKAPDASLVYRFYNRRTGTHFFTIDPNERDSIVASLGGIYSLDGAAYGAYPTWQASTAPLYRFYNMRTGTHFYTADGGEWYRVSHELSSIYKYEGVGYFICDSGGLATSAVYRFYNKRSGVHFYTADIAERDSVIANLGWLYNYEGPAFNVPK